MPSRSPTFSFTREHSYFPRINANLWPFTPLSHRSCPGGSCSTVRGFSSVPVTPHLQPSPMANSPFSGSDHRQSSAPYSALAFATLHVSVRAACKITPLTIRWQKVRRNPPPLLTPGSELACRHPVSGLCSLPFGRGAFTLYPLPVLVFSYRSLRST